MIQHNAGLFCPVFLFQAPYARIFVIDGKCVVLFIKSNLFFFKAVFESCWFVMNVQERIKLLKVPACCSWEARAFVQCKVHKTGGQNF